MTGQHTLKIEAARAGVAVDEYQERLSQGLLYCYRCQDWHPAGAFPADGRRHSGRAGSCRRAILAAARDTLAERSQPAPLPAVWVIRRPQPPAAGQAWAYWRGPGRAAAPGRNRPEAWSPAPDSKVARFPGPAEARAALIDAFGGTEAVPPGCRLVRLALVHPHGSIRPGPPGGPRRTAYPRRARRPRRRRSPRRDQPAPRRDRPAPRRRPHRRPPARREVVIPPESGRDTARS